MAETWGWDAPFATEWGMNNPPAPGGYPYGAGPVPWGEMGLAEIGGWRVPKYFGEPPQSATQQTPLGPQAAAVLAQLFPNIEGAMWPYPVMAGQREQIQPKSASVGMWESGAQPRLTDYAITPGREGSEGVQAIAPTMGQTAAVAPIAPSAQLWRQMESMGVIPMFNSYLQAIGIDPTVFQSQAKGYQPIKTGIRPTAQWKTPQPR